MVVVVAVIAVAVTKKQNRQRAVVKTVDHAVAEINNFFCVSIDNKNQFHIRGEFYGRANFVEDTTSG